MSTLAELRADGYSVAVHNDYRVLGKPYTFWLFTHADGTWLKGEGETDDDALEQCRALADLRSGRSDWQARAEKAESELTALREKVRRLEAETVRLQEQARRAGIYEPFVQRVADQREPTDRPSCICHLLDGVKCMYCCARAALKGDTL